MDINYVNLNKKDNNHDVGQALFCLFSLSI